ncbi:MAG: chemotaxis protein CheW [Rickettsiales bacterium]|nr:chemotaxis protein CheW [Rickettsiales bacterium]
MDEVIADFLEETRDSLEQLDQDLIRLEQAPQDMEIIGAIFRVMHTIKGTCGFLSFSRLESIAHAAENIMDRIRDGKMQTTPDVVTNILKATDVIRNLVEEIAGGGQEPAGDDSALVAALNACAEGKTAAPAAKEEALPLNKTPDLDYEIDFEPVRAPGSEPSETAPAEEASGSKTPDLDYEIDFEPVRAPGSETEASVPAVTPENNIQVQEDARREAIEEGLRAIEEMKAGETPAAEVPAESKANAATQTIRVRLDVLDELMQMVSELVLTRNQLIQLTRGRQQQDSDFNSPLQRLNHITTDLQEGVMKTRMQPIGSAWAKFPRIIRDLGRDLSKKVELKMVGEETELDRQLLEVIKDPLTHMVRNSMDHGLETREERAKTSKPETGTITLKACHEGGHIIIEISDDGRGLNVEKIRAKAVSRGLVTEQEAAAMSDKQIYQYIFKPGFSTAEQVTAVSGRGVGMDVVVRNIQKIGGIIELDSMLGKGSTFKIKIPLTLAIMPALIIRSAEERYAIPQIRVLEIVRIQGHFINNRKQRNEFQVERINDTEVLRLRGRLLPLVSLSRALERRSDEASERYVVICELGPLTFGLKVDSVLHTEEIVVKPVASLLKHLDVYAGCTVLGDGQVIMILDPGGIVKSYAPNALPEEQPKSLTDGRTLDRDREIEMLLFKAWGKANKVVPLELVSRLEEIPAKDVEWSGDRQVVQYRGQLMHLVSPDPSITIPTEGILEVIVFEDEQEGMFMGLVVEEIIDITLHNMDIKSTSDKEGILGSLIIDNKTTELIDVSHYFTRAFGSEWLRKRDPGVIGIPKEQDSKHVLLVDDSPFFRRFMKPVLTVADFRVTTAKNAIEACQMLDSGMHFDAVITDIDMPEMTGVEFVHRYKKERNASVMPPFVALTSHTTGDVVEKNTELGFSGYVSKSDRSSLVNAVHKAILEHESHYGGNRNDSHVASA